MAATGRAGGAAEAAGVDLETGAPGSRSRPAVAAANGSAANSADTADTADTAPRATVLDAGGTFEPAPADQAGRGAGCACA